VYAGEIGQGSGVMPISVPVDSDQVLTCPGIGVDRRDGADFKQTGDRPTASSGLAKPTGRKAANAPLDQTHDWTRQAIVGTESVVRFAGQSAVFW
jgi:hypothetical protein